MSYLKTSHFGIAVSGIKSFKGLKTVTEKSQKFSLASAFSRILIWRISEIASKSVRFETGNCIGKEFHWNCNGKEGENNMVKTLAWLKVFFYVIEMIAGNFVKALVWVELYFS